MQVPGAELSQEDYSEASPGHCPGQLSSSIDTKAVLRTLSLLLQNLEAAMSSSNETMNSLHHPSDKQSLGWAFAMATQVLETSTDTFAFLTGRLCCILRWGVPQVEEGCSGTQSHKSSANTHCAIKQSNAPCMGRLLVLMKGSFTNLYQAKYEKEVEFYANSDLCISKAYSVG